MTPLHHAAAKGHVEVVAVLLQKGGVNVSAKVARVCSGLFSGLFFSLLLFVGQSIRPMTQ
jgi:ankyrin repeat protein